MIYGYARVSRKEQKLGRQLENLRKYNENIIIYKEKISSTTLDRDQLNKLLKTVKLGDTIVFDSVSRMSRNHVDGKDLYFELVDRGINLVFLKEPDINSKIISERINRAFEISLNTNDNAIITKAEEFIRDILVIQAKEQVGDRFRQAQKEIDDTKQRIKEALALAKANGIALGGDRNSGKKMITKKYLNMKDKIIKMDKTFEGVMKSSEVMEILNLSRNTYFKYKREIKAGS